MAVAPKFAGLKAATGSLPNNFHSVVLYLDYVCPFSKKLFTTVYNDVLPLIEANKYPVQITFANQVQPWHPSSTLAHEASLAVLRTDPAKFWAFSAALFDRQAEYFDVSVVNETRNATYARLAALAAEVGVDEKAVYGLLEIADKAGEDGALNSGNKVTDDLKQLIKAARLVGIHVSPTVLFNGLVENSISSSWSKAQWQEWLDKNVV
ncbi:hypothetical protein MBLNU459_g5748t1 [Dothideomycetes sp. NU459]